MNDDISPEAVKLALAHCHICHRSKKRIQLNGVWVCPDCDGGWEMPAMRERLNP